MSAGPQLLDRVVSDSGTSVTFAGITTAGQHLSTSYSWATPELAQAYMPEAEAFFRQRLTQEAGPVPAGRRDAYRHGRLTGWVLTGLPACPRPRVTLKTMRGQRRRALLFAWRGTALAVHWGDR